MNKKTFPRYISNKPIGEDNFSGGSHKKIAKKVSTIIKNDLLETRIIGLEGDWGSGKSNVVKMVQKELANENYFTFIYDAWGNQEDLTRKSFLEQIINELFKAKLLKNSEKWSKKEAQLLGKSSKSFTQKFPKIKKHWFFISFSAILITVLSNLYENAISSYDIINNLEFGIWKPIISIYLIPFASFLIGFQQIRKEYLSKRKENDSKSLKDRETKWDTLGKILYWFSGNDLEMVEIESIIEQEPSILLFREYFVEIEKDLEKNNKLIIVFDNLDRLAPGKVKSLWSSIHTFFAESKDNFNSYVIVPYNQKEMINHFGNEITGIGFLEKSIPISFRVTPPVVTDWENFMSNRLDDAFGRKLLNIEDRSELINLYDSLVKEKVIIPRKIINHINDLVTLYLNWEESIVKGEIKLKYLSLFIFIKEEITEDPYVKIPNRAYLKNGLENTFIDIEELDESIAAITFGVERKNANEVLLNRELKEILRQGDVERILNLVKHSSFQNYFKKAYYSIDISIKINGLTKILNSLSEELSTRALKPYWNDFADNILEIEGQFKNFNENHKQILLHANINLSKIVIQRLLKTLSSELSNDENQIKYYTQIISIEEYTKHEAIDINLSDMLKPTAFNAEPYLELVTDYPVKFDNYKISCTEDLLLSYVNNDEGILNPELLDSYVEAYAAIKKKKNFSFDKLKLEVRTRFTKLPFDVEIFEQLISVVKTLFKKPIDLELPASFYSKYTSENLDSRDKNFDSFCIAISNFDFAHRQSNFQSTLQSLTEDQIKKISERIEWYIPYGELIKLNTNNSNARKYSSLNSIIQNLTAHSYGTSRLDINWVLENYSKIIEFNFDSNEQDELNFIKRIAVWEQYCNTEVEDMSLGILKHFDKKSNLLIKRIIDKSKDFINALNKDEFYETFSSESGTTYSILKALIENNLIESFSSNFYSAFSEYFIDIAKLEKTGKDVDFWDYTIDLMDKRKLKSTYTSVRDILISERGEITGEELYFLEKGLILHGNLDKKPHGSTLKIIIPMIKSDKTLSVFLSNKDQLLSIIDISEHKETALNELETKFRSGNHDDKKLLKKIAEEFGWSNSDNNE